MLGILWTGTIPDRALIEVIMTVFLSEARMFAALSATNEAILRADAPEELFKRVCDAAVFGGGFKSAGALLAQGDEWLAKCVHLYREAGIPVYADHHREVLREGWPLPDTILQDFEGR